VTLGQQQEQFAELFPYLIDWIIGHGYTVRIGEVWRPPQMAALYSTGCGVTGATCPNAALKGKGIAKSRHTDKCAVDLLLFKNGVYLTKSVDYKPLGAYWKSLHPTCRWGGDFRRADGNHFSLVSLDGKRA